MSLEADLALALRAAAHHGLSEGVCNHFSVALPDDSRSFLINPRGLHWSEVQADDIVMVDAHGAVPSPDGRLLATSGRGSSNIYLVDAEQRRVIGNTPNPAAGMTTNPERLSSGLLLGREPHEPTFTRNGRELWVTLRGEDRIAIVGVDRAVRQLKGADSPGSSAVQNRRSCRPWATLCEPDCSTGCAGWPS